MLPDSQNTLAASLYDQEKATRLKATPILDLVGNRSDKNSVGHGNNVALFTGKQSRFFYATHELGDIFSAADGTTLNWFPDHVTVTPQLTPTPGAKGNVNVDRIEIDAAPAGATNQTSDRVSDGVLETRQVCVTKDDVVVSRLHFQNTTDKEVTRRIEVMGDCRQSFDWRGKPGGEKTTRRDDNGVLMLDKNVFPSVLSEGLAMLVGGTHAPLESDTSTPGAYRLVYEVRVPAHGHASLVLGCAIERTAQGARANLARVLEQKEPLATNRDDWQEFYEREIPRFECSDAKLNELYDFRWFLLKFSTAGGDLGLFKYPVVMEGRQAFQTYCCYSAPFMAFDMNWARNPLVGYGHMANMKTVAYSDGRFPWYSSPRTNDVPLDHPSKTGVSLLPHTLWQWYQIHGDKSRLAELYPLMKQNQQWWIADRDPDGNGLFSIDHQLETGMDDLHRRWKTDKPARYEAVDATTCEYLNLLAVSKMARELGHIDDAVYFGSYAQKSAKALRTTTWDGDLARFRDRNPDTGELSDYNTLSDFYPLLGAIVQGEQLKTIPRYLLSSSEYLTAHPWPAMSQSDPEFDPVHRYWAGPTWPAANSHIIEGLAATSKAADRAHLPAVADVFKRIAYSHVNPRADFYERYDPFTGQGLSDFRDYMHSWWVDFYIRHICGLEPQDDGSLVIDPLPMNLQSFSLRGAPHRGHLVDVLWNHEELVVEVDGEVVIRQKRFQPGTDTISLSALQFK